MSDYEYKVVPAPTKGRKAKGRTSNADRFAVSVEDVLNEYAALGWEYQRSELLPSDERSGLTGSTREWRNVLIFRRATGDARKTAPVETSTPEPAPRIEPQVSEGPRTPPRTDAVEDWNDPATNPALQGDTTQGLTDPDAIHQAHVTKLAEARRSRDAAGGELDDLRKDLTDEAEQPSSLNPLARAVRLAKGKD